MSQTKVQLLEYGVVHDTKTATQGGSSVATTWTKRDLTLDTTNSGISVASSVITLPAGTWHVSGYSSYYEVNNAQSRLQNTTGGTTLLLGQSVYAPVGCYATSVVEGVFTIAASQSVELQYYTAIVKANTGLGVSLGIGGDDTYSKLTFTRVS